MRRKMGGKYQPEKNLPGIGGIYTSSNLALFTYSHQKPLSYSDPNGQEVFYMNKNVDAETKKLLGRLDKATPRVDYWVTSGKRTAEENKSVGGATNSHHLESVSGTAVDVNPVIPDESILTTDNLAAESKEAGFTGVITYPHKTGMSKNPKGGRLHLDRRDKPFYGEAMKNKSGKTIYKPRNFKKQPVLGDFPEGVTDDLT